MNDKSSGTDAVIALRAQFSEHLAALDALTEIATGYKRDLDEAHALLRGIHDGEISGFERYSKIEALLSASAEPIAQQRTTGSDYFETAFSQEPSAPVEIDERAKVQEALFWLDDFVARCNGDDRGSCSAIETLRAALERKP
ncbi:hypothetical protein MF6396_02940 [Pseudomonas sp. MF6396]|uniref:hypothetical protein n=1 Tax=Pseudomonas sp. MF6396 TaxID=1960828 RepID=UPI0009973B48|nr:hypothetical protein [Pseudomonas sp. MF6396]OOW06619.1 hypothetical protein MF6396_02940 [Pseudomonas sp. MF6396]